MARDPRSALQAAFQRPTHTTRLHRPRPGLRGASRWVKPALDLDLTETWCVEPSHPRFQALGEHQRCADRTAEPRPLWSAGLAPRYEPLYVHLLER
jgi:hypothetical protein